MLSATLCLYTTLASLSCTASLLLVVEFYSPTMASFHLQTRAGFVGVEEFRPQDS